MIEKVEYRPRYSLRELLALTSFIAIYLGVLGWAIRNAEETKAAEALTLWFLIAGFSIVLYIASQRRTTNSLRAGGASYATLAPISPLGKELKDGFVLTAIWTLCLALRLDRAADLFLLYLPLVPIYMTIGWLTRRRAFVTEKGLFTGASVTPWHRVGCFRDERGVPIGLVPDHYKMTFKPHIYLVPEDVWPIVQQLVRAANGRVESRIASRHP